MIKRLFICLLCISLPLADIVNTTSAFADKQYAAKFTGNNIIDTSHKDYLNAADSTVAFNIISHAQNYESTEKDYETHMKQDLLILMMAYPEYITGIEKDDSGKVYVVMKSGKKFIYDDKMNKSPQDKLDNPDLQDILEDKYPLNKDDKVPDKSFDPGRCRNYEFLNEVYGGSRAAIEKNLVSLKYGYPSYQFNSHNNANTCLESALKEIMPLAKSRGDISSLLYPGCGTYNYRVIAGTGKLSPHSYGIALDLNTDKRDYWKWSSEASGESRLKEYPSELVTAFENNNFIWGGKWGHFDIMHFEYRPEIILKARYFSNWDNNSNWYSGVPEDDEKIKEYINTIENSL